MTVSGSHEWRSIAPMSTRRSSVGVGVLGGFIYAVGEGFLYVRILGSIEIFHTKNNCFLEKDIKE